MTGAFTGPNTWSGRLTLTFTGSDCSCSGLDTPGTNQAYGINASR